VDSALRSTCACGINALIAAKTSVCREHTRLELVVSDFPKSEPGQFVQIRCNRSDEDAPRSLEYVSAGRPFLSQTGAFGDESAFLRRPFSIGDRWKDARGLTRLAIVSRTVGPGTAWLEQQSPGDAVNLTGPLGRGFRIPDEDIPLILIGGGVGIPPLIYLARRLREQNKRDVTGFFGAVNGDLLPLSLSAVPSAGGIPEPCAEFGGVTRYPVAITTDDGSLGMRGVATDALRGWLEPRRGRQGLVYACGPEKMLAAVADLTREYGLDCQLCIERMMGCGLGSCLSCVVRVHDDTREDKWRWALTCKDGPVFDRDELTK